MTDQSILDVLIAASAVRQDDEGNWEYLRRCDRCGEWVHLVERQGSRFARGKCQVCKAKQSWEVVGQ